MTIGQWQKYPNPINQAVVGTDVTDRRVVDGVLHSHRLVVAIVLPLVLAIAMSLTLVPNPGPSATGFKLSRSIRRGNVLMTTFCKVRGCELIVIE